MDSQSRSQSIKTHSQVSCAQLFRRVWHQAPAKDTLCSCTGALGTGAGAVSEVGHGGGSFQMALSIGDCQVARQPDTTNTLHLSQC